MQTDQLILQRLDTISLQLDVTLPVPVPVVRQPRDHR